MPRTAARIKGESAVWGIESDLRGLQSGLVLSVSRKRNVETDSIYDHEGYTIAQIYYDEREEVELEVICKSDTTAPAAGDTLTIGAVQFLVQDSELIWENRGWKKLRTRATYYPNLIVS
ncbi:hypothetical protein [Thermosphaera sp.]